MRRITFSALDLPSVAGAYGFCACWGRVLRQKLRAKPLEAGGCLQLQWKLRRQAGLQAQGWASCSSLCGVTTVRRCALAPVTLRKEFNDI